jgi:hypothetical protein
MTSRPTCHSYPKPCIHQYLPAPLHFPVHRGVYDERHLPPQWLLAAKTQQCMSMVLAIVQQDNCSHQTVPEPSYMKSDELKTPVTVATNILSHPVPVLESQTTIQTPLSISLPRPDIPFHIDHHDHPAHTIPQTPQNISNRGFKNHLALGYLMLQGKGKNYKICLCV